MAVKKVLMIGNPLLRVETEKVVSFDDGLLSIIQDIKDTLKSLQETKKIGRSLAAPQIGYLTQIIYVNMPQRSFTMINPVIVSKSTETFQVRDSCYSFDVAFFVKIERNRSIEVEYQDETGAVKKETFDDDLSELLQHEIDHLHGILATDYLQDNKDIILREEWEKLKH